MQSLIVGCDAGGSSVAALAWSDGRVLGHGTAGPANLATAGVAAAADAISAAVLKAAGRDATIAALYVGAAGAGRIALARALQDALRERLPHIGAIVVEDDARIALRAAIPDGPGVVVVAGTGSVAYAESGSARVRVGGAGYLVGDEGSAFAIGRAAIRKLTRAYDGREPSSELTEAVAQALGVGTRDELIDAVYARAPGGGPDIALIASLAPGIVALAGMGESAARSIVRGAAADLTVMATAAARGAELHAPRIAFAGGLLEEHNVLFDLLRAGIEATLPGAQFSEAAEEPQMAAVLLAREALRSRSEP